MEGETPRSTSTTSGLAGTPTPSTSMGKVNVSLEDVELEELLDELFEEPPPLDVPLPEEDPLPDDPPLEDDPPPDELPPLELELPCDEDPPEDDDEEEEPCAPEESCVESPLLPPHAASCKASAAVSTARERRRMFIP